MSKDEVSQARKPGPNDITDDIGNVVGNNKKGAAPPDRAQQDMTPDEVAKAPSRDSEKCREPSDSPSSADTGRKGGSSIQFKMYPRPGTAGRH